jgi:hypothetical protein
VPDSHSQTSHNLTTINTMNRPSTGRFLARNAILTVLFTTLWLQAGFTQQHTDTIRKTAMFQSTNHIGNTLQIKNITGDVSVEGYDGDTVEIIVVQTIRADNDEKLETAKNELHLVVEENGDHITIYIDTPYSRVSKDGNRVRYNVTMKTCEMLYSFSHDIKVRVPRNVMLKASTISNGDVIIRNMDSRELNASNVNGGIEMTDVAGKTSVKTVNGDIKVAYRTNPAEDSEFRTVNGSIDVRFPADLSADIHFKSLNGDLYTDFENVRNIGTTRLASGEARGGGTRWRINRTVPVRIGDGGRQYTFHVLNGDVFIRRAGS